MTPATVRELYRSHRGGVITGVVALGVRLLVVLWSGDAFPPTGDGSYYQVIATRIAQGLGYTWLWPDGAVTYAAHYPVGYPALLGLVYWLTGPSLRVAIAFNAIIGALGALGAWALARRLVGTRGAWVAGMLAALHPGLVFYTPALMTESLTATLWVWAAWASLRSVHSTNEPSKIVSNDDTKGNTRRSVIRSGWPWWLWALVSGGLLGLAVLVRTQSMLLIPLWAIALTVGKSSKPRAWRAVALSLIVVAAVSAPWAIRNRVRMGAWGMAFNGGWNLLIGTNPDARGTFAPLKVPRTCRTVFDEAQKDRCFGRAALENIAENPTRWLSLVPAKLSNTFDYCGAPGWYLHQSNPKRFPWNDKVRLGVIETLVERLVMLMALAAVAWPRGKRRMARISVALVAAAFVLTRHAWPAYVLFPVTVLLGGAPRTVRTRGLWLTGGALGALVLTHAVFFGSGRYAMPSFLILAATAGALVPSRSIDESTT